ncbi:MAG: helix-turn-helix transcriptional regulator [Clostridia bacterium]|nr:helix-turn-helix transcriptional regulator [Clostridia bacterium]
MDISFLNAISPYVRRARIMESKTLIGEWTDYDYCCTLIESGQAVFRVGDERYVLQRGDLILIPPFIPHMIFSDEGQILRQYIFHFDFFYDPERATFREQRVTYLDFPDKYPIPPQEMLITKPLVLHLSEAEQFDFTSVFLRLVSEYRGSAPLRNLILKHLCLQLLTALFVRQSREQTPYLGFDRRTNPLVTRAMDYIRLNYDDPTLSNEKIAAEIHVSTKYLSHLFRQEIGVPVHRYLNCVRILAAQKLARFDTMNLSQIATAVGFANQQTFCKVLRRTVHSTPTKFLYHTCADNEEVYLKLSISSGEKEA